MHAEREFASATRSRSIAGSVVAAATGLFILAAMKLATITLDFVWQTVFPHAVRSGMTRHATATIIVVTIAVFLLSISPLYLLGMTIPVAIILTVCLVTIIWHLLPVVIAPPPTRAAIDERIRSGRPEKWLANYLRNPVDAVWFRRVFYIAILIIPVAVGLFTPQPPLTFFLSATIYLAVVGAGWGGLEAFEHANSHYHFLSRTRSNGARKYAVRALSLLLTYPFSVILARIPYWYEVQHVAVHHAEDNGWNDTQSTLPYDRSSFVDFTICAGRFAISGMFSADIIAYLIRNRRYKPLRVLLRGMAVFYAGLLAVALFDERIVILILLVRYIAIFKSAMSFFQEHGLIDPAEPLSIFRNSLHYISDHDAHCALGDDAHIEHHLRPARHWTEYQQDAANNTARYMNERAIGLRDIELSSYYGKLWRGAYEELASYLVFYGNPQSTPKSLVGELKLRLMAGRKIAQSDNFIRLDRLLGRVASHLIP